MDFQAGSRITDILSKKVTGEVTPDEQAVLDRWIAESDENRGLYEEIVTGCAAAQYANEAAGVDARVGLERIARRISRSRRRRVAVWSAAAAVTVVAVSLIAFMQLADGPGHMPEIVSPAMHLAILETAGGQTVELTEAGDGTAWRDYVGQTEQVEQQTADIRIRVPRGSEYSITLDDGSQVWLNSESVIEYPQRFAEGRREVKLSGEAYFEVARDEHNPFVVVARGTEITVLGTSFNVAAYEGDGRVTATLVSGSVEVAAGQDMVQLSPGQQAVVGQSEGGISVVQVDPSLYSSWTRGVFEFEKMTLADICARLGRWYDVEFEFADDAGGERFTGGTTKEEPLGEFLQKVERVTDISFRHDGDRIVVARKR